MANFTPRLIPRKVLSGIRRVQVLGSHNIPEAPTETSFDVENSGVQPVSGWEANALPEGYRDRRIYKIYTTTPLLPAEEGTSSLGDLVEAETGVWCLVIRVQSWQYGVQSHYEAVVAEVNER